MRKKKKRKKVSSAPLKRGERQRTTTDAAKELNASKIALRVVGLTPVANHQAKSEAFEDKAGADDGLEVANLTVGKEKLAMQKGERRVSCWRRGEGVRTERRVP